MSKDTARKEPIVLGPEAGRRYGTGAVTAVFKADGAETNDRFSISEWWLEPHTEGPGAHTHEDEDSVFYVIEGTASLLLGDRWIEAPRGTFVLGPAGVPHDFANRTDARMGLLSMSFPGGFEKEVPAIMAWFENRG